MNRDSCDDESAMSGVTDSSIATDSFDEEVSSCSSSSKETSDLGPGDGVRRYAEKVVEYTMSFSDVETMKEMYGMLLLGEDPSGGCKGVCTALALSHAITSLSVSIYGELWKLEPLSDEKKNRWRREMDWLLSPTNYMVELVPTKQNGANGSMLEIMTPKARADVHMILPALRKLDSMLIEVLDSMVNLEFWYVDDVEESSESDEGSPFHGAMPSKKRWCVPSPRVPELGLSGAQRKKLGYQGKLVHQVLKAAKSINESTLLQMPLPSSLKDALPKSGRASLGENLYKMLASEVISVEVLISMINLKSEQGVLETVNRLERAIYVWNQKMSARSSRKPSMRSPFAFVWDARSERHKVEYLLDRAKSLLRLIKLRFPSLPPSFQDVTKVHYNKDVGYSIVEAYSRVIGGLAFNIMSRIGDVLQEDDFNKPSTPVAELKFDLSSNVFLDRIVETAPGHIKHSLMEEMNSIDGRIPQVSKSLEMSPGIEVEIARNIDLSPDRSLHL